MQKLVINRTNGNILKALDGQDHISGLLFLAPSAEDIPAAFADAPYAACSTIATAQSLGLSADATGLARIAYYHISEAISLNAGLELYVGFVVRSSSTEDFSAVAAMQQFAGGNIRQIGIWDGSAAISTATVTALQGQAEALEAIGQPISIVIAPKVANIAQLPTDLAGDAPNVSVLIGQDGAVSFGNEQSALPILGVGIVIGLMSLVAVNESIAWVSKCATGVSYAAFADGTLYRNVDTATITKLDNARYLFFKTYAGVSGVYLNDSHNMDDAQSDFCSIELERTMDKAVRGIRTYLLPELGRPLHFNADGTLRADTLQHLKTVAGKAIEDMESAGEVDGYSVDIDSAQDVQSTSTLEFCISQIPVGVLRKAVVNIGYTKSV